MDVMKLSQKIFHDFEDEKILGVTIEDLQKIHGRSLREVMEDGGANIAGIEQKLLNKIV